MVREFPSSQVAAESQAASKSDGKPEVAATAPPAPAPVSQPKTLFERRADAAERKRVAQMTPDEMRAALFTDDLTGLHNGRWLAEHQGEYSHIVAFDADSLKWVNDNLGHAAGDRLLQLWGEALRTATATGARAGGDEFFALVNSQADGGALVERVRQALDTAGIESVTPSGETITISGLGVSFGVGTSRKEADERLIEHKRQREAAGTRAGRGEPPPGTTRRPAQGQQDRAGVDQRQDAAGAEEGLKPEAAAAPAPPADDARAYWTRSTQAERTGLLAAAGWSVNPLSLSTRRTLVQPWDKLTDSQRSRLSAAAATPDPTEAPKLPATAKLAEGERRPDDNTDGGKPYTTPEQAKSAMTRAGMGQTHDVVAVDGGAVIREKSAPTPDATAPEATATATQSAAVAADAGFKPFDADVLNKKPTPASVADWYTGQYEGRQVWTNGHIIDLAGVPHLSGYEKRLSPLKSGNDKKDLDVGRVIPKAKGDEAKAFGWYDSKSNSNGIVYFDIGGKLAAISTNYYRYFASKYKGAQFFGEPDKAGKAPISVWHDGKLVGLVMPIRSGGMDNCHVPYDHTVS